MSLDLDGATKYAMEKALLAQGYLLHHLPEVVNFLFSPKQVAIHLALVTLLQSAVMGITFSRKTFKRWWRLLMSDVGKRIQKLEQKMEQCSTYKDWTSLAEELDCIRGLDKWRTDDSSPLFDGRVLRKRIADTQNMLFRSDIFDLMFRLRGGLARDQDGTQHEGLYTLAAAGTKNIVEKYHTTVATALNFVCDSDEREVPDDAKLAFFNETRHSYGRTALLLSGGAYLGYYHMGVSKALWGEGLLPRVISGASAGSLMAAMIGSKTDKELEEIFYGEEDTDDFRRDYFKTSTAIRSQTGVRLEKLLPEFLRPYFNPLLCLIFDGKIINLDIQHLKTVVIENVGQYTFQEAFDRTGRIINITVAPLNNFDPPRLLNYLTAPHVCVWSAAVASCAIPGIFDSCVLVVKEPNGNYRPENEWTRQGSLDTTQEGEGGGSGNDAAAGGYTDGSIESDLPMQQLSELFNVNHFIVSQVNPHSALLSSLSLKSYSLAAASSTFSRLVVGYTQFLKAQCRDWLKNFIALLSHRPDAPSWGARRGLVQMLTQNYEGRDNDVTIFPWVGHLSAPQAWMSIIKNPTDDEYKSVISAGEHATWPFLCRIRAQCHVEMTLDKCVQRLRRRIADSSSYTFSAPVDANVGIVSSPRGTSRKGLGDRVPSFYTSRSIINLSGLSVTDTAPPSRGGVAASSRGGNEDASHDEVMKSSSMAKFYYKKSAGGGGSDHEDSSLGWKPTKKTGSSNSLDGMNKSDSFGNSGIVI